MALFHLFQLWFFFTAYLSSISAPRGEIAAFRYVHRARQLSLKKYPFAFCGKLEEFWGDIHHRKTLVFSILVEKTGYCIVLRVGRESSCQKEEQWKKYLFHSLKKL